MKKKIFLLILVTILLSGCSVKYNLYINEDLSVNETVVAYEEINLFKVKTGQNAKVAANSLFQANKIKDKEYTFTTIEDDNIVESTASISFDSLEEYRNYFKTDLIKEVNITEKDNIVTLEYEQDVKLTDESSKSLPYESIEIRIYVPYMVTETNAERVEGKTYIWTIKKEQDLKDIKISFNKSETDTSKKFNFGLFEVNIKYSVIMISGIITVGLLIVLIVYINNKKNNRI